MVKDAFDRERASQRQRQALAKDALAQLMRSREEALLEKKCLV